ncbi:P-loop containing nucleoside triphosphate hydrolase protein, partial [Tilletiopsis washingtonensis]
MKLQIDEEAAKTFIYPTNKELRDYQFNIVKRALFSNTLVALPTGLGKTFIAAVVILNYFNWFPQGKIIFVAPTRPLVSQQQMACHGICGLPWDVAVEMTGATRAALRGDEWESKRIFYMTPQCFQNDLAGSVIDARDVCCVVVDEAHRATGGYAYGNVIRYLTQRNPYFRVLALSATPGNKAEKVQEVVDNLHISNIEIRTEDALDIRKYVHKKLEMPVVVPLGGEVREVQQLWGKMMMPAHKAHLVHTADPTMVHPFAVRQSLRDPKHRRFLSENKHFYSKLNELASMAQAMQYLTEHSVGMFHTRLLEYEGSKNVEKGGKVAASKKKTMMSDANADYRKIKVLLEKLTIRDGRFSHPKMWYLRDAVTAHFAGEREQGRETRVMVFCSWRECVTEIVDYLNDQDGTDIRATQFIGQSADRQGRKGFKQSDQELVIHQFKKGFFNVIVATSIGEEGLDIGEIDLIVCYEAVKDSVRMLQRVGRTGRKRDGKIIVLMSEGREEKLWQQSKDNYKAVQQGITTGLHLELFDDVPRLVPQHITP